MAESQRERYRLERKISGKGSFGELWLATDTLLDRPVAIKYPKAADDPIRRERFLVEARMLARLNHANITQIYDAFFDEKAGYLCLVIEYVDGKDLAEIIRAGTPLPLDIVLEISMGILGALSYAHEQGLVHRDVKPDNILIADDVKLTDFGLASLRSILQMGSGFVAGTPAYMAPEQVEGRPIDSRADLYALGVILFEMLSGGRLPFEYEDKDQMLAAHLNEAPPPVGQCARIIPPMLEQVVMRLLAKDPDDRYPSATAVIDALDSIQVRPKLGNLPVALTPFIGREPELAEIHDRLQDPDCRLLTLVGPGGSGKTRLALKAAEARLDDFTHGVFFVRLAPLDSEESIAPAVADALGFSFHTDTRGGAEVEPRQQLLDYLRQKGVLIVLDSFEHLLNGVGLVAEMLRTAPDVKILVTSRARLNLQSENLFFVSGMDFPHHETSDDAVRFSAVQLFLQGACRMKSDFAPTADDVQEIVRVCRLVQGMPLGILLAAAWVEVMTLAEIVAEIGRSLDFLETDLRDVPARQRSIRAAFDHSWNLLADRERELFQALSVFRGGFTRQAARKVTGATLSELMALINKSLLHPASRGRYGVHELLRGYAAEKLDRVLAASQAARDQHCVYYVDALYRWANDLKGAGQHKALAEMDEEIENARAAWSWAVKQGQVERLDQAIEGLCRFYQRRGRYNEGEAACRNAAVKVEATAPNVAIRTLAKILVWQSVFSQAMGNVERANQLVSRSLALVVRPDLADQDTRLEKASALLQNGHILVVTGQWPEAHVAYRQSLELAEQLNDFSTQAWCQCAIGELLGWKQGQFAEGSAWLERARAGFEDLGDQSGVAEVLKLSGTLAALQGDYDVARRYYEESLAIQRRLDDKVAIAALLNNVGIVVRRQGDLPLSRSIQEEALAMRRELGNRQAIALSLNNLGLVALEEGNYFVARLQLEEAVRLQREVGDRHHLANALHTLGNITRAQGDYETARSLYHESLTMSRALDDKPVTLQLLGDIGMLAAQEGQTERALCLVGAAIILHEASGARLPPADQERLENTLKSARQSLGEEAAATELAKGRAMSLEEAIDYAFQID